MSAAHAVGCPHCGQPVPSGLALHPDNYIVQRDTHFVKLTPLEFYLFEALYAARHRFKTRSQLIYDVWINHGLEEPECALNQISVLNGRLRKKLRPLGITIRGHRGSGLQLNLIKGDRGFSATTVAPETSYRQNTA